MLTLRCTRRLLDQMGVSPISETAPPTTVLGNWYANLILARPHQIVMCMNERSLLVVLLPAQNFKNAALQFQEEVSVLLTRIGVSEEAVAAEKREMAEVRFGATANRRVLGCLKEAAFALACTLESCPGAPVEDVENYFSEYIYSTIRYRQPRELAIELFAASGVGAGTSVLRLQ